MRRCLFDNHIASSFQKNLEYMYKHFGFALPDAEYLRDPEGLLRYLGAKLQYGNVPLYTRGDDANVKKFGSLHAVQRHMIDSGKTQMCYDGNEEEYEDFYDYECAFVCYLFAICLTFVALALHQTNAAQHCLRCAACRSAAQHLAVSVCSAGAVCTPILC